MSCVYVLTNRINGKRYVGQTVVSFKDRMRSHRKAASAIGNAIRKYGVENFDIEINPIEQDNLDHIEKALILFYDSISSNGYNLDTGGNKNKRLSLDAKQSLSKAHIGFHHTKEACRKIGISHLGHEVSEETKEKISLQNRGKKRSKESSEQMSQSQIKRFSINPPSPNKKRARWSPESRLNHIISRIAT